MDKFATALMFVLAVVMFVLSGVFTTIAVDPMTQDPATNAGAAVTLFGIGLCFLATYIADKIKQR